MSEESLTSGGRRPQIPVLVPQWPAPAGVAAFFTTRYGGVSSGRWADAQGLGGLNLGENCGDEPRLVAVNRRRLEEQVDCRSDGFIKCTASACWKSRAPVTLAQPNRPAQPPTRR
jgi:hypothetical protein